MPSLATSVEMAVAVDDDDPGELLAVNGRVYAGKPPPAKSSEEENVYAEAQAIVSGLFGVEDKENVGEDATAVRGEPSEADKTNADHRKTVLRRNYLSRRGFGSLGGAGFQSSGASGEPSCPHAAISSSPRLARMVAIAPPSTSFRLNALIVASSLHWNSLPSCVLK